MGILQVVGEALGKEGLDLILGMLGDLDAAHHGQVGETGGVDGIAAADKAGGVQRVRAAPATKRCRRGSVGRAAARTGTWSSKPRAVARIKMPRIRIAGKS